MTIVQIRTRGAVTIPASLRRKYGLNEGDMMTLIDVGDGCFVLSPRISEVGGLANEIGRILADKGISEEEMLLALAEERQRYYTEQYARD